MIDTWPWSFTKTFVAPNAGARSLADTAGCTSRSRFVWNATQRTSVARAPAAKRRITVEPGRRSRAHGPGAFKAATVPSWKESST